MRTKHFLLMVVALVTTTRLSAQKVQQDKVPDAVKRSLHQLYPKAEHITWEKEQEHYEAEFKNQGSSYSLLLNASGDLIETELEILSSELPSAVKKYLEKNHPKQKIKEAARITDAKGVITYEAEIKGKDLIFDAAGNFIR